MATTTGTWTYDSDNSVAIYDVDATTRIKLEGVVSTEATLNANITVADGKVTVNSEDVIDTTKATPLVTIKTYTLTGNESEGVTETENTDAPYSLALGAGIEGPREGENVWDINTTSHEAYYKSTTTAGYEVESDSKSITYTAAEVSQTPLVTLTGINTTNTAEEIEAALEVDDTNKVITVDLAALGDNGIVINDGENSDYKLVVGNINNPIGAAKQWTVTPARKSSVATYQQATRVEYELAGDSKSITKLETAEAGDPIDLATITGLAAGLTVADINDGGIEVDTSKNEFNMHLKVLGGAVKLTNLADTNYALTLDEDATESQCSWTVSNKGVAAYNQVTPIKYTLNDDKDTITGTGKAVTTTLATVSGVNSGLIGASAEDLNKALKVTEATGAEGPGAEGATITLGKEAFGMANLTYANANGSKYAFSANTTDVPSSSSGVGPAWVINGTTATYINCASQAYYTDDGAKYFMYHAPVPAPGAQPQITITGLKKGVTLQGDGTIAGITFEEDSGKKTGRILISKELFGGTNIAISGSYYDEVAKKNVDYTLGFAENAATDGDLHETAAGATYKTSYVAKKGTATITQEVEKGYTLTENGKGILYSKAGGDAVVATVAGLAKELKTTDFNATTGVITLTDAQLPKNPKGATVTVTGTGGCTLATEEATVTETKPAWSVSGTTATYKSTMDPNGTPAYSIAADGKSIYYLVNAKDTVIATVSGVNANLTEDELNDDTEPVISFKADGNGENTIIVLEKRALTSANISAAAGYSIEFGNGVYTSANDVKDIKQDTWVVSGTKAELIECTPAYYVETPGKKGTTYVYNKAVPVADKVAKVTLTGLKKNLMVNADGSIDGITFVDTDSDNAADTIKLDSKVLGGGTVTVNGDYVLALDNKDSDLDISEISYKWEAAKDKKGNTTGMTLTQTRTNGYDVSDDGKTITCSFNKKDDSTTTSLFTLTGIETEYLNNGSNWGEYKKDAVDNDISLVGDTISINSKDVLGAAPLTVGAKSAYKLAIGFKNGGEAATENKWEVIEGKKGALSYAYNRVVTSEGGYALSADSKTISSMAKDASVTLVTLTGLNENLTEDELNDKVNTPIAVNETAGTVTLKKGALGTSVISVAKGSTYKLQLDSTDKEIATTAEQQTSSGWVVSGTTAKYQTYINGYYTHNAAKNTITYTPPSADNSNATITLTGLKKGIAANQDGEIDGVEVKEKLITLKKSALGTTDVTWKGDGYTVELYNKAGDDERVPTSETTTEWAQNPKNATSWTLNQEVTEGFELDSANKTVKYSASTKPTALFTLNGLKSDLTEEDLANTANVKVEGTTVYLGTGALGGTNVTLALPKNSTAYTLALDEEILQREKTANEPQWIVEGTTATYYDKCNMPYYKVSGNTVTYHPAAITAGVSEAIIEITGLRKGTTLAAGDITVNNKTVTLSKTLLEGTSKVTVSGDYKLKLGEGVEKSVAETPVWTVTQAKKNNALADAKLTQEQTKGYICNGNTITAVPKNTTATLVTLSGINADLIKAGDTAAAEITEDNLTFDADATDAEKAAALAKAKETARQGAYADVLAYSTETETVTVGDSAFVGNGTIAVGKGSTYKIAAKNEADVTDDVWEFDKKNNATYTETKEAGKVTSADGKSIKNSITETKTSLVTIAGFNPKLTKDDLNGGTSPISIDTKNQAITLTNGALDPSRTVVIGTKGSPYTFVLDEVTTEPTKKQDWVITGGKKDSTAEYILSETAYYKLGTDAKSVSYVPTAATSGATAEIKITGLKKGAVVDNGNISLSGSGEVVTLKKSILGTGTITIYGDAKIKLYSDATDPENVPVSELGKAKWSFSNGKKGASATLTQEKPAGYVLAADGKTVTYVAKTTVVTLATVSGINPKLLDGITDEAEQQEKLKTALKVDGSKITLNSDAIVLGTTTNVTLTRGKDIDGKATTYELDMKADVPRSGSNVQWYVDGQTVKYIECDNAHYELAENKLSISYQQVKPAANAEAKATISGLRKKFAPTDGDITKDVTIDSTDTNDKKVVVSKELLDRSGTVTLDGDYTFEFKEEDVTKDATKFHKAADIEQVWTNTPNKKGVIGTLTQERKIGYTISNDGKSIMNLAKLPKGGSLVMATVTGLVSTEHVLKTDKGKSDINLTKDDLREDGGVTVDGAGYTFNFDNTYTENTITAGNSGNKITAAGDKLIITGGKGNDNITASGQEANINGGAGNDVISATNDNGATIAGGAGDDNITLNGKGGNIYVYNIGEGNDVINNFKTGDTIKLNSYLASKFNPDSVELEKDGSDLVVTVAVGVKKKQGTITLVGAASEDVKFEDKDGDPLTINLESSGNAVEDPVVPTNELLYSSNYSQNAAQLDQVTPTSVNDYSVGDINTNQDATALTQNATIVTTSTNKK